MKVQPIEALLLCACLLTGCTGNAFSDHPQKSAGNGQTKGSLDLEILIPGQSGRTDAELTETTESGETETGEALRGESENTEAGSSESAYTQPEDGSTENVGSGTAKPVTGKSSGKGSAASTDDQAAPVKKSVPAPSENSGRTTSPAASAGNGSTEQQRITFLVEVDTLEDTALSQDGVELASYSYQIPVMVVLRRDRTVVEREDIQSAKEQQALAAAETFNAEFRKWADEEADFDGLEEYAKEIYEERLENSDGWDAPFHQSLECEIHQIGMLISVTGNLYSFAGGAHPNTMLISWNFDIQNGKFLSPEQLFEDTEPIQTALLRRAEEQADLNCAAPEDFFFPDFRDSLSEWADTAAVSFDESAMTVAYSPYDLAPYAAGPQVFTIPMEEVFPSLNDYGRTLLNGKG